VSKQIRQRTFNWSWTERRISYCSVQPKKTYTKEGFFLRMLTRLYLCGDYILSLACISELCGG